MTTDTPTSDHDEDAPELALVVAALAGLAGAIWLGINAITLLTDGAVVSAEATATGVARLLREGSFDDPARAFSPDVARHMPAAHGWWLTAIASLIAIGATSLGAWRRIDIARSRAILGRRPYDVRGSRPRPWGRPRDLASLTVRRRMPGRFTLGTLDRRLLVSDPQAHVALIAPTRAGKTTRYVIPWLLEHDGPAIVTSTKRDIYAATHAQRAKRGDVYLWDPFADDSCTWNPVARCSNWSHALRQARWLADATQEGDSEIASYWRGESARLLAPLLHAAALEAQSIADVLAWLDTQDVSTPGGILKQHHADPAVRQLAGIVALDPRNRGTTYMSAGSVLAAYRFPEISRNRPLEFSPDRLLDRRTSTLYVVASDRDQRLLRPLVVALISSTLDAATERARERGPLHPTLRVLLDEAANIAPLRDIPAHLSQAAAHGVRIATVWQSYGQIRHRYGSGADGDHRQQRGQALPRPYRRPRDDAAPRGPRGGRWGRRARRPLSQVRRATPAGPGASTAHPRLTPARCRADAAAEIVRVARDEVAFLGNGEDLPEPGDRLVDRLGAEDVLADLVLAIAVDLGDGDLAELVEVEERQQVVGQLPAVVGDRRLAQLLGASGQPFRRELAASRRRARHRRGRGAARALRAGESSLQPRCRASAPRAGELGDAAGTVETAVRRPAACAASTDPAFACARVHPTCLRWPYV